MNRLTEIKEIIKKLEILRWKFNGYDHCNYEFVFMKQDILDAEWVDFVAIHPDSITFSRRKVNLKEFKCEYDSIRLNQREFPLFMELYNFMHETRQGLPLDMAKEQKAYDNAFKWECGDTYCTFENGTLSCGVVVDE